MNLIKHPNQATVLKLLKTDEIYVQMFDHKDEQNTQRLISLLKQFCIQKDFTKHYEIV